MRDIEPAVGQRGGILRHRAAGDPRQRSGIDAVVAQILFEAKPRGRHLADAGEAQPAKLGEVEAGVGFCTDQRERVAAHHLGEGDKRRARVVVVMLHDPDRAHPHGVDFARGERRLGAARPGGGQELDREPLIGIGPDRMRRVERRVQHKAVILK